MRTAVTIALLVNAVSSCIPVNPGNETPCPAAPLYPAGDNDIYTLTSPTSSTENGNMVLSCAAGTTLVAVVDGTVVVVDSKEYTAVCKPNSGKWVYTSPDTEMDLPGTAKVACATADCPELDVIMSTEDAPTGYTKATMELVQNGNDQDVKCPEGSNLYDVSDPANPAPVTGLTCPALKGGFFLNDAPQTSMIYSCLSKTCTLPPTTAGCPVGYECDEAQLDTSDENKIVCPAPYVVGVQDGANDPETTDELICVDGKWQNEGVDVVTPQVTCAKDKLCSACATTLLVDPTFADCKTNEEVACVAKPTINIVDGCNEYECDAALQMYTLTSSTTATAGAVVTCVNNELLINGNAPDAAVTGIVCGKPSTCDDCTAAIMAFYTPPPNLSPTPLKDGPTCAYKCPVNTVMKSKTNKYYEKGVCDIGPQALTFDSTSGDAISADTAFICEGCSCPEMMYDVNVCPKGALCTATVVDDCTASCPDNAQLWYTKTDLQLVQGTTLLCAGGDWNVADAAGSVTCQFTDPDSVIVPTLPENAECVPLQEDTAVCNDAGAQCDFSQLKYYKDENSGDWYATCKSGTIVENQKFTPGSIGQLRCLGGDWSGQVSHVNCRTDEAALDDILDGAGDLTDATVECAWSLCTISCPNGVAYNDENGAQQQTAFVRIDAGVITFTANGAFIDDAGSVHCA